MTEVLRIHGPGWAFWCPGCECLHAVNKSWTFNGDVVKPTIKPSVLSTFGINPARCHLFVEEGRLRFLSDSTHQYAGQTIDMVPIPWD